MVSKANQTPKQKQEDLDRKKLANQDLTKIAMIDFLRSATGDGSSAADAWQQRIKGNASEDQAKTEPLSEDQLRKLFMVLSDHSNLSAINDYDIGKYLFDHCAYMSATRHRFTSRSLKRSSKTLTGLYVALLQLQEALGPISRESEAGRLLQRLHFLFQDAEYGIISTDILGASDAEDQRAAMAARNDEELKTFEKKISKMEKADAALSSPAKKVVDAPARCATCGGNHLTRNHTRYADKLKDAAKRKADAAKLDPKGGGKAAKGGGRNGAGRGNGASAGPADPPEEEN
jgi:hypothetical protein